MALSAPNTPRQLLYTTPRRLGRPMPPAQTPECFSRVTVETPVSAAKRRSSRDKFDQERNLTVAVRVRPMNARELACVGAWDAIKADSSSITVRAQSQGNLASMDHCFQYDHVFWSCDETNKNYSNQEDVFECMGLPLLNSAFRGYNACLFAYGQTGSGKSYSMMGQNTGDLIDIDVNAGVIPRFCKELFNRISNLDKGCTATVEISYFEIYNEKIHDLFAESSPTQRLPLKVREHPVWGPYVVDLSLHTVKSYKEIRSWLLLGNKNRATAATAMNEKSSRSHSIFSIEICLLEQKEGDSSHRSKISLVDLAGSERLSNGMNNEERIRQGVSINKSLLTLGKVISALAEHKKGNQFVPYRDSVLTWLLRESLGGNSLTSMLATITPASSNSDETLATLRYACQARSIVNRARINENPHDKLIRELRAEVERLRALRQDYERNSIGSIISMDDSIQQEQEMEELRLKLSTTEEKLQAAKQSWERRFMESKELQMRELAEAEKRKEELESHIRVMKISDTDVNLSPYRSNFLQELEGVLVEAGAEKSADKMDRDQASAAVGEVYEILKKLRPIVLDGDQNLQRSYDDLKRSLRTFKVAFLDSMSINKKTVTFKL